jgi:hypothetical protein
MTTPCPSAIRLVARTPSTKPPRPPFGLRVWSTEAETVGVLLDEPNPDHDEIRAVAEQVPLASTLPAGTSVIVLGAARSENRLWRLLGRTVPVPRAARCTALLVRGYVDIGAGLDERGGSDLAWGSVP